MQKLSLSFKNIHFRSLLFKNIHFRAFSLLITFAQIVLGIEV